MKNLFFGIATFVGLQVAAQQTANYQFSVDLTAIKNDWATVELITPTMSQDEVTYRFPAMVPGTYHVYDFGRFTRNFKAFDKAGKELQVSSVDVNSWKISGAKSLYKITYEAEDTWDTDIKKDFVFEPAGTNFQQDTNYVLNNHGLFGYFDGMKRNTYQVSVTHPNGFYGSTALQQVTRKGNTDTYTIPNYMDLVDSPMMYNRPDTTHINVGGADVLISVYSPNKLVSSKFIADSLRLILDYQRQYLGGKLPVDHYAFIIYLTANPNGFKSGSMGALEHSYSSFYALGEMKPEYIAGTVKDVAAHEFFHVLTPLTIHSEEIGDFDYNNPRMSQHLWMYEGLTEYAAHHVQIKYGSLSLDEYLEVLHDEMVRAMNYDDALSFTEMSKGCLDKYEDQYNNVYQKGALIGLCLDIKLRQLSDGKYGTQDMMLDLSKKYGKDKSFKDADLFNDIVALTYPEIGEFFKKYVIGGEALPFDEIFDAVGIDYTRKKTIEAYSLFGGYGVGLNDEGQLFLFASDVNDFGKEMGYQDGDILLSMNGKKMDASNAGKVISDYMSTVKTGKKLKMKVRRKMENGSYKTITLKSKIHPVKITQRHLLAPQENLTEKQKKLRKAWINK